MSAALDAIMAGLHVDGYAIVENAVQAELLERLRAALHDAEAGIIAEVGRDRLLRAGEAGTLRLPMRFNAAFFDLLELPIMLEIVDATIGPTAILHLQNGFILPSEAPEKHGTRFANSFHRDFPRYLNGTVVSVNVLVAIDAFTRENGATLLVPGSHQAANAPSSDALEARAVAATAPPGSFLVFDSTLWHAAGKNVSGSERLAVNHQFTCSWIKQQFDYVRAMGGETIQRLPERTQQLLGWYTRVVTSLDEYYRPPDQRLYRGGQG